MSEPYQTTPIDRWAAKQHKRKMDPKDPAYNNPAHSVFSVSQPPNEQGMTEVTFYFSYHSNWCEHLSEQVEEVLAEFNPHRWSKAGGGVINLPGEGYNANPELEREDGFREGSHIFLNGHHSTLTVEIPKGRMQDAAKALEGLDRQAAQGRV